MHARLAIVALALAAGLSRSSCKRTSGDSADAASSAAPGPATMPAVVWTEHEATIGDTGAKIRSNIFDLDWTVSFDKLPRGTTVHVGDKDAVADNYGHTELKVRVAQAIADLSPKDALDHAFKFDPKLTIEISFPNQIKVVTSVPPTAVRYGLVKALDELKDKPVLFGPETDAAQERHTVLWADAVTAEALGPAATMKEVDWIALPEKLPGRKGKMCPGYKDKDGKSTLSLPLEMIDEEVTIYERRRAKAIDKKKFTAIDKCPMFAIGKTATVYADTNEIKKWLRERRDRN